MVKSKRVPKEIKLGKYDVRCSVCNEVIKGALRETCSLGDFVGTVCCDKDEKWCHLRCL